MKSIIIVFATFIIIAALPFAFSAIDSALSQDIDQSFAGVTTAGNYTADVTLGQAIMNNSISSIKSITSNQTSDNPTAYSYNSVSKTLTVSGLNEGLTHTLTLSIAIPSTSLPDYMAVFFTLVRWFMVLIPVGMSGGAIYAFFD